MNAQEVDKIKSGEFALGMKAGFSNACVAVEMILILAEGKNKDSVDVLRAFAKEIQTELQKHT